jgi:hypothetical protein
MDIKFPNGYFVKGTVLSSTGAPLKSVSVFVGDAAEEFSGYFGTTDAAGKFSIPVQPGTKYVRISPPASTSVDPARFSRLLEKTVENITVSKDTGIGAVKLRNGFILSGKIDAPAGTPALKSFSPSIAIYPAKDLMVVNYAQTDGAHTGIDDKYAVAVPAGSYRIWTTAGGTTQANQVVAIQPTMLPVKVGKDTVKNIVLPKGRYSLSGTVKDTANTKLSGFLLVVSQSGSFEGGVFAYGIVDEGVFGIDPKLNQKTLFLPPGQYRLMFLPLLYISPDYKGRATVTYFDLTMPASAKTLSLVAENGFILSGKATDAGGKAMPAIIAASNKNAQLGLDLLSTNMMIGLSDEKGNYRIALPADTLNVQAFPVPQTSAVSREMILQRLIRAGRPAR